MIALSLLLSNVYQKEDEVPSFVMQKLVHLFLEYFHLVTSLSRIPRRVSALSEQVQDLLHFTVW